MMKKTLALLGLVAVALGVAAPALAISGSDSSGTHSYSLECDGGTPVFTNTSSSGNPLFVEQNGGATAAVQAGASLFMGDGNSYTVQFRDPPTPEGSLVLFDSGTVPQCEGEEVRPPALISECRGADWYIVHPGGNWTYRFFDEATQQGAVLVPVGSDTDAQGPVYYGEYLVPVGDNSFDGQDDFNATFHFARPDCTVTPTEPTAPGAPALAPASGDGFVAAGADIGPGNATFGATGFGAGEQIEVVLHSTPRPLGTVTANADGLASITFEVLASDGAGEHSVVFTGPTGTVSVPFTLVLPAQTLPQTR
jgi:hypothetical protein